jgi:hypothetical protein
MRANTAWLITGMQMNALMSATSTSFSILQKDITEERQLTQENNCKLIPTRPVAFSAFREDLR